MGIELEFKGSGDNEVAVVASCSNEDYKLKQGTEVVAVDKSYFRPTEVDMLIGDPSKAKKVLGWEPKYKLKDIVSEMVASDVELFKRDKYLKEGGHQVMGYHE